MAGRHEAIFDSGGTARAYITSGTRRHVSLWDGRRVGQLRRRALYGLNGHHLGWYINGVVYDREGFRVGFRRDTCPTLRLTEPPRGLVPGNAVSWQVFQSSSARPPLQFAISDESLEGLLESGSA